MAEKTKEAWYDECIDIQRAGNLDKSITELKRLTEQFPDYGLAHLALAVFYDRQGMTEEVMSEMHRACELEENDPFYYTAFSVLAIRTGRREEAEEALMKAQQARFAEEIKKYQSEDEKKDQ